MKKALVYVAAVIIMAVIQTAFTTNGIILGAIPTVLIYGAIVFIARKIIKSFDE